MWETPLAGNVPTANRSPDEATVRKVGSYAMTPSNYELAEVCHSPPPVYLHVLWGVANPLHLFTGAARWATLGFYALAPREGRHRQGFTE